MTRVASVPVRELVLVAAAAGVTTGLILATADTLLVATALAVIGIVFTFRRGLARAARRLPGAVQLAAVSIRFRITALVLLSVFVSAAVTIGLAVSNVPGSVTEDIGFGHLVGEVLALTAVDIGVGVVVGFLGASVLVGPLRSAAEVARRLGAGDLDARIQRTGSGEVAELFLSYNTMAEQLTESLRQTRSANDRQRRFIADAAHELRTPLAALIAASEGLTSDLEGRRNRATTLVQSQSQRLADLVSNLLEISSLDANEVTLNRETCDLEQVALDAAATVAPEEAILVNCFGNTWADVDAARVHSILRNLLSNALQHGAPPVTVEIDGRDEGSVHVSVEDEGPGVPQELEHRAFDRFIRGQSSRTTAHTNTGLGLAISQENARLHGAALNYYRNDLRTRFTVSLPRNPPKTSPVLTSAVTQVDAANDRNARG